MRHSETESPTTFKSLHFKEQEHKIVGVTRKYRTLSQWCCSTFVDLRPNFLLQRLSDWHQKTCRGKRSFHLIIRLSMQHLTIHDTHPHPQKNPKNLKTQKHTQVFSGLEIQAKYRTTSPQTCHYTSGCENWTQSNHQSFSSKYQWQPKTVYKWLLE